MPERPQNFGQSQSFRAILPLLVAVMLLVFGTNLQGVLLPILGHERGAGMTAIGLYSAGWSLGFVLACVLIGRILNRLGPVLSFTGLAVVSAASALLIRLLPGDLSWILLRVLIGFCYGGLAAIVEGWLVWQAGTGVGFSSYMVVSLLASLCGTLSLDLVDPQGLAPFLLMIAAVAGSMLPVLFNRARLPPRLPPFQAELRTLFRLSPLGTLGCVGAGLITGAVGGLGPVFGMMDGLDMRGDTLMLAANAVGGAVASLPVGMLTRRLDRRALLGGLGMLGVAVCVLLVLPLRLPAIATILLFGLFGCAQYPLYALCVGIANARSGGRPAAQVASELLLLFGLGTVGGPLIAAPLLRHGSGWMFGFIGLVFAAVAIGAVLTWPRVPVSPRAGSVRDAPDGLQ